MAELVRVPATKKIAPSDKDTQAKKVPELSPELAEVVAAVTAMKPSATAAPFITVMQKEAVSREMRRRRSRRYLRYGLAAVAVALFLHLAILRFFFRVPTPEALDDYGLVLATEVLPLYSSLQLPLQVDRATVQFREQVDSQHLRYFAEVTLRLRQPLYLPASTNGTEAYRLLQESLQIARADELKFKLFPSGDAPPAPELPLLLQMSHRLGEALVVRVPFEAKRTAWRWRIEAPRLDLRSVEKPFNGASLARYAESPYLVFGTAESRAEIRRRERLARDYIVAVTKEVQKRADVVAVTDSPADAAAIELPSISAAAVADVPTVPELPAAANQAAIDPDAPAIEVPEPLVSQLKAAPPPGAR